MKKYISTIIVAAMLFSLLIPFAEAGKSVSVSELCEIRSEYTGGVGNFRNYSYSPPKIEGNAEYIGKINSAANRVYYTVTPCHCG